MPEAFFLLSRIHSHHSDQSDMADKDQTTVGCQVNANLKQHYMHYRF